MATVKWGLRVSVVYETHDQREDGSYGQVDSGEVDAIEVMIPSMTEEEGYVWMKLLRDWLTKEAKMPPGPVKCTRGGGAPRGWDKV